ncbi:hypothetical protein NQ315_000224 [Exocentrus adspersus]|uniref:Apolipophorin n=1 Tax=Exocentrus adspersus TaxID=1586481 RepID=A0AAV8VRT3_9CUCU|nr:hypothetical protein NQ315_000224 [Exocentrus adspersus]
MGRTGPSRWGPALALVVLLVIHNGAHGEETCRTGCKGTAQTFKYAVGTTYKYNYEGKIDITLSSAEGQVTSTEVKAVALLTQQAECNLVLRLQNVQVLGPNGKKFGQIPDVEKPIRLNFHDGHIEDQICVEQGDNQNSINIKRAVASLFQANLKGNYETDAFGVCPTDTAQQKEGNTLVIQKSRNLNKCAYREVLRQDFFSPVFNLNSEIKSSPILDADYRAKLRIKNGILEQASVIEDYLYTPFSVGRNGAKAQVTSSLRLTGTSKDNPKTQCNQPRSIIFENPHPVVAPTSNVNSILNAVKGVVNTIDVVVGEQTAKEFVTLIKAVRSSRKDDLLTVYNQVKSGAGFGAAGKKAFLDALLEAGTGDSVEVAITLLKNNELGDCEKRLVYLGLSLVKHATESSINAAASLLDQRDLPYEAYLGIGNLAGRYCRQHSCKNVDAINKLTQKLIQKLGNGKAGNRQEENEIIYVLKALANFHYISDSVIQKITAIAQDKNAPNRLRVAALETYLADACKDKLRNSALHILQDIQQDSEVRIKAYLAAAQCANSAVGTAVKALLEKEPSYQVGGFIVSHIRNIRSSANPDKEQIKQHLGFSVPNRFPVDFRKWSYNGEFSYAVDTLGVAASTETNIIYSQDSFLPRSTSLNLTAEIFGHTFNFLQIQTRQENLDRLVEHYFGPKGLLKTSSLGELLKTNSQVAEKIWKQLGDKLREKLRLRRDVSRAEIESIGKAVQIKENELNKDLDLDVSFKAFGSEILFANLNVYQGGLTPDAIIDKIVDAFGKGIDKLKQFDETLRSNLLFLDVEFAYPTGLGFPLRLAVEGTSSIQVKTAGSVDVRALVAGRDTDIKVEIIPSANIEVAGRLTLDALVVENGLKVVSNLYTATGGDLTISLRDAVDVKFGLPVQEQKLISATHEIVFHTREQAGKETNLPLKFAQSKDFSICLDQISPFIGLTFCGEINGPNLAGKDVPVLPFPFAGDAKVAVTIENDDVSEYHFRQSVSRGRDRTAAELVVETIGKNKQKKVSFQINAEASPEKYIRAVFTSPVKSASAEARITNNAQEKSLSVKLGHDQNEFGGKVGVAISGSSDRAVYRPILEYKAPGKGQQLPVNVQGQIIVEQQGPHSKYIFDNVRITLPDKNTYSLKGNFGNDQQDFFSDLTLSNGQQSGSLKGRYHFEANLFRFNTEVQNTINPSANFHVKGEVKKQPEEISTQLQLIHGADLSSKSNIITFTNTIIKKYVNPRDFRFGTKNKLTYPVLGIDSKFELEHTPKSLDYDLEVQYNDIKFGSELEVEINGKEQGDYSVELELYGLDNKVEFKSTREVQGEESKISNELEVNGKKLEVKGKIRHHVKPSNVDVGTDLTVVLPMYSTPFKVNSGLKYNPSELDAHHKVTSGSTVVVDVFLKANKGGNANGSIKVNIKSYLVVNGQLKSVKGSGTGEILIDAQNIKKQVKVDTTFQVQAPQVVNVEVNIYPSYATDKNQKVTISTQNKGTATSLDSKNQLNLLGQKLEVNFKGSKTGDDRNGKVNGEVEVTLPNDQYLLGKVSCDHKLANDVLNGQSQASLEYRTNKNASGRKVSIKTTAKDTNPKKGVYDIEYNLAADDSNGKNINADIVFKAKKDNGHNVYIKNKIYGSIIKNPLETEVEAEFDEHEGQYKLTSTYGSDAGFKGVANYDILGEGKPITGHVNFQLKSSSKSLKVLEFEATGSLKKPQTPSDYLQLEGSVTALADDDGTVPGTILDFEVEGNVKGSDKDGEVKGKFRYGEHEPISATAGYSKKEDGKQKQLNGNLAVQYGKDKNLKLDGSLTRTGEHQYKLEAETNTPIENYKNTKIVVQTKRDDDNKHVTSNVQVISDGKTWNLDTEVAASELAPLVDIKLKCPEGKISRFYVKGNKVSDKEFSGELKIVHEDKNFLLEGDVDANIQDIEEFFIKANLNAPSIKINKASFEAHNKPGKTGKRIQVTIKSAGKNLVSGSTSYQAREEQGKYVVEGSGSFKVKEETQSANFKYICQRLNDAQHGEQGVEVTFDAGLGNRAIDAELKITNKQFRILNSYCEAKKECAHFEIDAKTTVNDIQNYNQEVEINVDLRKLGLANEFGVKAVTNRKGYVFDHTVDVHFQSQESNKYQYSLYIHPTEAGVSFTTPKRIIALEAHATIPKNYKQGGKVSGEVAFYLDKKHQPNKKTSVSGWVVLDAQRYTVNGESKLTHPGLQRPLSVSLKTVTNGSPTEGQVLFTLETDVFAHPNQKIVATYKITTSLNDQKPGKKSVSDHLVIQSQGLGIDIQMLEDMSVDRSAYAGEYSFVVKYKVGNSNYDNEFSVKAGKTQFNLLVKLLNVDLLRASSKLNLNKEEQIIDSEISSYDNNPLTSHLEVKGFNTFTYTVGCKKTPRDKIQFNGGLIPGQIADVRADHVTGGGKVNLFHATLKLDHANFLKPDYSINSKEIESVLDQGKNKFSDYVNGLQNIGKGWSNDIRKEVSQLGDLSKRAAPNLKPLRDYYTSELQKIKNEILADKSVKELGELLRKVFGAVAHSVGEIFAKVSELVESVVHSFQTAFAHVIESIDKELIPELKSVAEKLTQVAADIAKTIVEIAAGYLAMISKLIEKYQPEIKQLAAVFGELGQDVGRFIQKAYEHVTIILTEQWKNIYNEIQALPVFEEIKAQYEELVKNGLANTEGLLNGLKEISVTFKDIIPQGFVAEKELNEILDLTVQYLEKKIKRQPVDDFAVIDKLIRINVEVVRKIINLLSAPAYDVQTAQVPVSLDFLKKLPKLVAIKFSPLAYLLKEDTSDQVVGFLLSLLNNPRQWVPPFPLFAMVVQGQHIFTFDGKHITFPGNCKYLLARDAVNGNFTLIGTYANGLLTAITLADAHDAITLKKGGQLILNNSPVELPARKPDLAAYRGYHVITLRSAAGVAVFCTPDLIGCSVSVSGYYHAQIKGLLGNGNNEPYDDYTVPNGKIVSSESDFANSYKIGSCAPVTVTPHNQHQSNEACNKLFGWESPLRYCYPFVSTENFKTACAHGLAAGVKDTEEAVAKAYVAICNQRNIPVRVPPELGTVKCTNSDKSYSVGDKFSVKVPAKAADIILIVETDKANENIYKELVQPLVQEIGKELHAKGINDVELHLIAYGGENQWPSHVTVNGKLNFKGKAPNLKFSEAPKHEAYPSIFGVPAAYLETFHSIIHDVQLAFGQNLQAQTYSEALEYPFRVHAVKSIIVVNSKPCEVGKFYLLQKLRTILYKNNLVSLNLFTPLQGFSLKDAKKSKDVIGFNEEHVFTVSQAKKKPEGTAELYKELQYDDYCVDFTIKNRGNAFVSDNFQAGKPDAKKQYIHIASHNIVDQLVNVEEGLDCECQLVTPYNAENVCREAYSKERPTTKKGGAKG